MGRVWKITLGLAALAMLWAGAMQMARTHDGTHDDAFTDEDLLTASADQLQSTIVTPHLAAPLAEDQNVLWCATFQLAWNEACALVGEDLRFQGAEPSMVAVLNQHAFTQDQLDAASYVAVAGFVRDDIFGQIERQLTVKFQGQAKPRFIPSEQLTPRPHDIVTYAYLFKNLQFAVPFERIRIPLTFDNTDVPCFGIGDEYKHEHDKMLEQVVVIDYQSEDDFIIELKTKGEQDQLVLAKVQPAGTLAETVAAVQQRMSGATPVPAQAYDVLKVPRFNFDVTRVYQELLGLRLALQKSADKNDLSILSAVQNVRFQLDETGVRLRSEAHIAFGCAKAAAPSPPKHVMILNRPFLMLLQRRDATVPYFALWVADPEILVKAQR